MHTINVNIPVGYKPARGPHPRRPQIGEYYLTESRANVVQAQKDFTHGEYIILIKDPPPIDTSTLEYKLEVVRQYMMGKQIQFKDSTIDRWRDMSYFHSRVLEPGDDTVLRIKPEGAIIGGEHDGRLCYWNDKGTTIPVPE